jgi:hypothetical protein
LERRQRILAGEQLMTVYQPIIDIAVAVASPADVQRCRPLLVELGYLDRGDAGREGGYVFVKERAPEVRTHHLHMVTIDDPQWANYLCFRDRLRADPAQQRERLAHGLAEAGVPLLGTPVDSIEQSWAPDELDGRLLTVGRRAPVRLQAPGS